MRSYYSFCALMNYDENCEKYIEQYGSQKVQAVTPATKAEMTLKTAIEKGLKEEAHHITAELVKDKAPLDIINEELIPALDQVGKGFEKRNRIFTTASDECRCSKDSICSFER